MNAIVLAGGTGSRLGPVSQAVNKHLLPVGDRPLLLHAIDFLSKIGLFRRVLIVTDSQSMSPMARLCSGYSNLDACFINQPYPLGIVDAIGRTKNFCGDGPTLVLLGDNVFSDGQAAPVRAVITEATKSVHCDIWVRQVDAVYVSRYGIAELDDVGNVISIVEKPKTSKSNLAITGLYLFGQSIWSRLGSVKMSARHEFEIVDLLNLYNRDDAINHHEVIGPWYDFGSSLHDYYDKAKLLLP